MTSRLSRKPSESTHEATAAEPRRPDTLSDALSGRLALRLDEVARALGLARRAIERERSAGRFPKPDLTIGRMPLWTPNTVREWVERGGK